MKSKFFALITSILAFFAPVVAFAQQLPTATTNLKGVSTLLTDILNLLKTTVLQILIALVIIFFFVEIFKWVKAAPDEKAKHGKGVLLSIVGIFILFTLWGVIAFLSDATGIQGTQSTNFPGIPSST